MPGGIASRIKFFSVSVPVRFRRRKSIDSATSTKANASPPCGFTSVTGGGPSPPHVERPIAAAMAARSRAVAGVVRFMADTSLAVIAGFRVG